MQIRCEKHRPNCTNVQDKQDRGQRASSSLIMNVLMSWDTLVSSDDIIGPTVLVGHPVVICHVTEDVSACPLSSGHLILDEDLERTTFIVGTGVIGPMDIVSITIKTTLELPTLENGAIRIVYPTLLTPIVARLMTASKSENGMKSDETGYTATFPFLLEETSCNVTRIQQIDQSFSSR